MIIFLGSKVVHCSLDFPGNLAMVLEKIPQQLPRVLTERAHVVGKVMCRTRWFVGHIAQGDVWDVWCKAMCGTRWCGDIWCKVMCGTCGLWCKAMCGASGAGQCAGGARPYGGMCHKTMCRVYGKRQCAWHVYQACGVRWCVGCEMLCYVHEYCEYLDVCLISIF